MSYMSRKNPDKGYYYCEDTYIIPVRGTSLPVSSRRRETPPFRMKIEDQ